MRNPELEKPPTLLTAGQIYTLVDGQPQNDEQVALAQAFNALPYNLDGIAVYDAIEGEELRANRPFSICFNGQLPETDAAGLRKYAQRIPIKQPHAKHIVSLEEDQKSAKEPVRSPAKFLGALGVSGATSVASIGFVETLADAGVGGDTAIGIIAAAGTYLLTRPSAKRRKIREAHQSLAALKQRALDPDEGAISFSPKIHSLSITPSNELTSGEDEVPRTAQEALWEFPREEAQRYGVKAGKIAYQTHDGYYLEINFALLIKQALTGAEQPGIFWHQYLGEKAKELSDYESHVDLLTTEITRLENIESFTGYTDDTRLEEYRGKLHGRHERMFEIVHDVISTCEAQSKERAQRERAEATRELMDSIATEKVTEAHEHEMTLQKFKSIVVTAISSSNFELTDPGTNELAENIVSFLQKMRTLLSRPSEIEFFYKRLHEQFSAQLPNLPGWKQVQTQFSTTEAPASMDDD